MTFRDLQRLRVGMKVLISSDIETFHDYENYGFLREMDIWKGKWVTVREVNDDCFIILEEANRDIGYFYYTMGMVEKIRDFKFGK